MDEFEVVDFERLFETCTDKTEVNYTYKLIEYRLKCAKRKSIHKIKDVSK
jgi:hypothetical protein